MPPTNAWMLRPRRVKEDEDAIKYKGAARTSFPFEHGECCDDSADDAVDQNGGSPATSPGDSGKLGIAVETDAKNSKNKEHPTGDASGGGGGAAEMLRGGADAASRRGRSIGSAASCGKWVKLYEQ